jgi:hypothetical protein
MTDMAKTAKPAKKATSAKRTAPTKKATPAKTAKQSLVVTLTGDRPIHEVAGKLRAAGLTVDQVMESVGIVTGSAPPDATIRLRRVRGVADVSPDHPVDIGPPDAPVS